MGKVFMFLWISINAKNVATHDWAVWYLHPIKDSATAVVITPGEGGFKAK